MLLKIKTFGFQENYTIRKKHSTQNFSSQEDIQIYFRALSDRTLSFRFNCKKRYKNEKFYFVPNLFKIRKKCKE